MSEDPQFHRPDGRPLPENHHLALNTRGKYFIRTTIDKGGKFVGERITVQTGTSDIHLARRIRDAVVIGWIKAGCITREIVLSNEPDLEM